jgi:hypothetical protein
VDLCPHLVWDSGHDLQPSEGDVGMRVLRRLGLPPRERGSVSDLTCPDVFELSDGSFAVIGRDMTEKLRSALPTDAGVAPHERIVVVPRETLIHAKHDIPTT